jgi:uncharacterized membrane protein YgcG
MRRTLFLSMVGLLALACGQSVTTDAELATQRHAISGGATTTDYKFVVGINIGNQGVCSGTLIAPNLVLTARHCVSAVSTGNVIDQSSRFGSPYAPQSFGVTTNHELFNGPYYGVAKVIVPSNARAVGNDIALMILSRSIPAAEAQPATPVVQHALTNYTRYSVAANVAIGYGITNPGANDSGIRRFRRSLNTLCIDGSRWRPPCVAEDGTRIAEPAEFVSSAGVCQGDSGSGFFDQLKFDQGTVLTKGVLSRGPSNTCDNGVYTRTDSFKAMIVAAGIEAATRGNYAAPAWTVDEPQEPQDAPYTPPPPRPDAGPASSSSSSSSSGGTGASSSGNSSGESSSSSSSSGESSSSSSSSGEEEPVKPPTAPRRDNGAECSQDDECRSESCVDNQCKAPESAPPPAADPGQTTVSASCSMQPDPTKPVPWRNGAWLLGTVLGTAFLRRRSRAQR